MVCISSLLSHGLGLALTFSAIANAGRLPATRVKRADFATQAWTGPVPTCTNGMADDFSDPNGTYTDGYGAQWQVECGQRNARVADTSASNGGGGIYACFRGCDKRPNCIGFYYAGTVTGPTTGTGICYYYYFPSLSTSSASQYWYTDGATYGGAFLLGGGSPNLPCPYYNGSTWIDTAGNTWQVS